MAEEAQPTTVREFIEQLAGGGRALTWLTIMDLAWLIALT